MISRLSSWLLGVAPVDEKTSGSEIDYLGKLL
jgi:hypothetical protein